MDVVEYFKIESVVLEEDLFEINEIDEKKEINKIQVYEYYDDNGQKDYKVEEDFKRNVTSFIYNENEEEIKLAISTFEFIEEDFFIDKVIQLTDEWEKQLFYQVPKYIVQSKVDFSNHEKLFNYLKQIASDEKYFEAINLHNNKTNENIFENIDKKVEEIKNYKKDGNVLYLNK